MAGRKLRFPVVITPAAQRDLERIWDYNAERYDIDHAFDYLSFLDAQTGKLETNHGQGRSVPSRPEYRYSVLRKGRGHGHIVVYHLRNGIVEVLRYFHTAQNWQSSLNPHESS